MIEIVVESKAQHEEAWAGQVGLFALYCICIALYLHCIVFALHRICIALYLYCIALHLYCIVLYLCCIVVESKAQHEETWVGLVGVA